MRQLLTIVALAATALAAPTWAADSAAAPTKPRTVQQGKMAACNEQAGDKKGDVRKAFMKQCLSAKTADGRAGRPDKMKKCNADAKGKTGADRRQFMSECLRAA